MAGSGKPFPLWPLIRGSKTISDMNLFQEYVCMDTLDSERNETSVKKSVFGRVYSLQEFIEWADQ
jgi:hypothetical protein